MLISSEHGNKGESNGMYRHGLSQQPLYRIWCTIKQRCYNPKDKAYKYYGGRGIKMCGKWVDDYEEFHRYIINTFGVLPNRSYSIDRIDNDGDYQIGNLRLANRYIQSGNRNLKSRSGHVGVHHRVRHGRADRWRACIGKTTIGDFSTKEEAVKAREEAERAYF